ncbi:MAG: cation-translocating P-type ATPase [Patescibacteria group bacterium]
MLPENYNGLTKEEAKRRREKNGPNLIPRKKPTSQLELFLEQFKNPLMYILITAATTAFLLNEQLDAITIAAAALLNIILGYIQERKSLKVLEKLAQAQTLKAEVLRNGKRKEIPTQDVVVGDLVFLKAGGKVPADGTIVKPANLAINEATLTGESTLVEKEKDDNAYKGTLIGAGKGQMIVKKTGKDTKIGQIAHKLSLTEAEKTPLQKKLNRLSKTIAMVVGILATLIFIEGILTGRDPYQMFITSVAIAVAAVPEGLAVSLTVVLALGMKRILNRGALIKKLTVTETLGSTTVICVDKTGTLTLGDMQVTKHEETNLNLISYAAALCNARTDPLEKAIWEWLKNNGAKDPEQIVKESTIIDDDPFESETKLASALTKKHLFIAGAPEVVLEKCGISEEEKSKQLQKIKEKAGTGLRAVGYAYRKQAGIEKETNLNKEKSLKWLGVLYAEDPVREEVKKALKDCQTAGVETKVVTGDIKETAVAVLKQLDIQLKEKEIITGTELHQLNDKQLNNKIPNIKLFCRTAPHQKLRIVEALQKRKEVVAMTGDGVNDSLALKRAEIGIVMGTGSEVAKETADMALVKSSFSSIVHAIEEGRGIYKNIRKILAYLLSDSFTTVVLIGGSLLTGIPLPILPFQILWINLVEDGLPGVALAFEGKEPGLLQQAPIPTDVPLLDKEVKSIIFAVGLMTDAILLTVTLWLFNRGTSIDHIRTITFGTLGLDSLLYVFSCRSLSKSIIHSPPIKNRMLLATIGSGLILLTSSFLIHPLRNFLRLNPLRTMDIGLIMLLGTIDIVGIELIKWAFRARRKRK